MGLLDRLLRRGLKVGPKELAYTSIAFADEHMKALIENELQEVSGVQNISAADASALYQEIYRAYFALASMRAGQSIGDSAKLNRYGAAMLHSLRTTLAPWCALRLSMIPPSTMQSVSTSRGAPTLRTTLRLKH